MGIPHIVRIGALVLATTAFYTYVGQMVPQKEVQPPEETAIGSDMSTAEMVKVGRQIMTGKGLCLTCHTVGKTGALRFPDLQGIGERAKTRVDGLNDVEYLAQSLYEPMAYVVPGFPPAMPPMNQPPFGLTDQEILCVIAALQTYGGTATVTLKTTHKYTPGATPAPAGAASPEPTKGARHSSPGTLTQPPAVDRSAHRNTVGRPGSPSPAEAGAAFGERALPSGPRLVAAHQDGRGGAAR
jgi:hypothetical protein